jgi:creatinine amidohydrolase
VSIQTQGVFVADVAWPEVMKRLRSGATALLPVGAACKEHGPHLPMNSDYLQASWLAASVVERAGVVVWPVVSYGYYPAFVDYPGSCTLSRETFTAAVVEILQGISRAGARRVRIINTGLSTTEPLRQAVTQAGGFDSILLLDVYDGRHYRAAALEVEQQARGGHADELETSIMLAIDPHKVDLDKAVCCDQWPMQSPFNRSDPDAPNYSPSGVYGDPTLASASKGRRLLQAMVADIMDSL